ncbi:MAG TPA: 16S rRNA (guanine(527)-N(7))-methyltransferase RsmG [Clostridiaceae bacterium]|nr:16S rRNA (guanine(527)-N(7))-methyltransferase RsmG [Clostridiaceae bacterium]
MFDENLKNILAEGAKTFNLQLDEVQLIQFLEYKNLLQSWNKKINLTAIEDDKEIIIKHFIDSLSIYPFIKGKGSNLIDIGTGAGFPGIPVKLVCPEINVFLLDSLEKRIRFLDEVIKSLNLVGISTAHGRAEDYGNNPDFREKFDIAVARAVASLPVLLEYSIPFVRPGGIFIAMKGSNLEELSDSRKALELLGAEVEEVNELFLPFNDSKRSIIIIRKLRHTPTKYPRKAGKPSKEPLL